jgi:hypothetical protein
VNHRLVVKLGSSRCISCGPDEISTWYGDDLALAEEVPKPIALHAFTCLVRLSMTIYAVSRLSTVADLQPSHLLAQLRVSTLCRREASTQASAWRLYLASQPMDYRRLQDGTASPMRGLY